MRAGSLHASRQSACEQAVCMRGAVTGPRHGAGLDGFTGRDAVRGRAAAVRGGCRIVGAAP